MNNGDSNELQTTTQSKQQMDVEMAQSHIERIMMELPSSKTNMEHRMYLSGVIDTYEELGEISEETRGILYSRFCF